MSKVLGTTRDGRARFHASGWDVQRVTVRHGVLVCNQCGHEHECDDELCFFFHPQRGQGPWVCPGECYVEQVESAARYRLATESFRRLGGAGRFPDEDEVEDDPLHTGIFTKVGA
ncbi:hypothetical protein LCGC14_0455780 [marine sediment metagenome]|uniref:Uncharacterized protein n=1 Tax=marine sediment metagenome TaxID=412755 RepID=A0A0F9SZJ1_9ZZZZ